ncbi:NUDIX domain-containing protein [Aquipuribacter nitratireducens]|uniref:NUDIX domain-containing protein n=1 Tax=Aquipuribacter nitratireducens TaxID=650104 RepID=A0ABW0GRT2_9MICO
MSEPEATALRLPRAGDEHARRWLESGSPAGPEPVPAASVCVLRDGPAGGVEVLWLTRGRRLRTWPGLLAFPGGAVEDTDRRRRPDDPAPPDRFTVLARTAARECAEETGVAPDPRTLRPFARWVTPEHEPRRFDTTFLVTVVEAPDGPDDAAAPATPDEVHELGWASPPTLLEDVRDGARAALPPTRAVLSALGSAATGPHPSGTVAATEVADRLVDAGTLVPVVPRAAWHDGPPGEDGRPDVALLLPRHAGALS